MDAKAPSPPPTGLVSLFCVILLLACSSASIVFVNNRIELSANHLETGVGQASAPIRKWIAFREITLAYCQALSCYVHILLLRVSFSVLAT